jgi:hypothetical protein
MPHRASGRNGYVPNGLDWRGHKWLISDNSIRSDGLWRRRFGTDPSIVGHTITLNDDLCLVIGIMPTRFRFPGWSESSRWGSPGASHSSGCRLRFTDVARGENRFAAIAKLRSGVSVWTSFRYEGRSRMDSENHCACVGVDRGRVADRLGIQTAPHPCRIEAELRGSPFFGTPSRRSRSTSLSSITRDLAKNRCLPGGGPVLETYRAIR